MRAVAVLGLVLVLAIGAVVLASTRLAESDDPVPYLLEPAPPSPGLAGSTASREYVPPASMVSDSEVVFVGTVASTGPPEPIGDRIADPVGQGATVRSIQLTVERMLRGEEQPTLELIFPAGSWGGEVEQRVFEPGERVLVFAETRTFGEKRSTGLTARGYGQGVFHLESEDVARHRVTGVRMFVPGLEAELVRTP